jgi:hypothetical protein
MKMHEYVCELCEDPFESTEVLEDGEILCDGCIENDDEDEDMVELDDDDEEDEDEEEEDEDEDEDELED